MSIDRNQSAAARGSARMSILAGVVLVALACVAWMFGAFDSPSVDVPTTPELLPEAPPQDAELRLPDPAPAKAAPAAAAEAAPPRTPVRGVVVLPSGAPAAGVTVQVRAGEATLPGTTDSQGRYEVGVVWNADAEVTWLSATAWRDDPWQAGLVARAVWGQRPSWELPILVLGNASALRVRVQRDGAPVPGARVLLMAGSGSTAAPWAEGTSDAAGEAMFPNVPGEAVYVLASAPGAARAARVVSLPAKEPVVLDLGTEKTLSVRVATKKGRDPITNAEIEVREKMPFGHQRLPLHLVTPPEPTDKDGRTHIRGLSEGMALDVRATAPDHMASRWTRVGSLDDELVLELMAVKFHVFDVRDGGAGIPPDDAEIRIVPWVFRNILVKPTGTMERGQLVVTTAFQSFFSALAIAPDGTMARLPTRPYPIAFSKPAQVEVRVAYPDGTPASGLWVTLQRGGQVVHWKPKQTDDEGHVTFAWPTEAHEVTAMLVERPGGDPWARGDRKLGSTMLNGNRARIEATLPWRREVVVRLTTDGERKLPPTYTVQIAGKPVEDVREDRAAGELRFSLRPREGEAELVVLSPGFDAARAKLPSARIRDPLPLDLKLTRGGTLRVQVLQPADRMLTLELQRFDRDARDWVFHRHDAGSFPRPDLSGRYHFDGLPPGRYRVLDPSSNAGTEEFELTRDAPVDVTLDCSKSAYVKGVVRVPKGYDVSKAEVAITGGIRTRGASPTIGYRAVRVARNGSFTIRVPGNVEVLLRAVHPELVDDPERGVRMTAPRSGIELTLEAGAQARIPLDPWPDAIRAHDWMPIEVLLFAGAVDGEPISRHRAIARGKELRFGGFAPGRYTIWVNAGGFTWASQDDVAPFVLPNVVLGEGTTTLEPVKTTAGGGVRVQLSLDNPETVRQVRIGLRHLGKPAYSRTVYSQRRGEVPIVLNGLGAGRFELNLDVDRGTIRRSKTIESDGQTTEDVTLDLRTR